MYLKEVKNKKTGRIYLSIAQSYRDNSSKYPKATTIKSLSYLDELERKYNDPIAYFNKEITRMNAFLLILQTVKTSVIQP
jgi:hypothetical protein